MFMRFILTCLGYAFILNQSLYSMIIEEDNLSNKTLKDSVIIIQSKKEPLDFPIKDLDTGFLPKDRELKISSLSFSNFNRREEWGTLPYREQSELVFNTAVLIQSYLQYQEYRSGIQKSQKFKTIIDLVNEDKNQDFYPKQKEYPYTIVQWDEGYMKNFKFLNFLDEIDKLYSTSVSWCPYRKNRSLPVIRWFVDNSGDFSYGGGVKVAVGALAVEVYDSLQTMMSFKTYEQGMTLLGYIGYSWILSLNLHRSTPRDFYGNFDYSLTPTVTYMYMDGTFMFSPYISVTYTKRYMGIDTEKYYSLGLYAGT